MTLVATYENILQVDLSCFAKMKSLASSQSAFKHASYAYISTENYVERLFHLNRLKIILCDKNAICGHIHLKVTF